MGRVVITWEEPPRCPPVHGPQVTYVYGTDGTEREVVTCRVCTGMVWPCPTQIAWDALAQAHAATRPAVWA